MSVLLSYNEFIPILCLRDLLFSHFKEYEDRRDADDAVHGLNRKEFDDSKIVVEYAKSRPKSYGGGGRTGRYDDRQGDRRQLQNENKCFNCGRGGHWARDCTDGDWT